jgi:post-segregation antitoxin (ccd killing protein)
MRMARVNITVPDAVLVRAREAGMNVSRLATAALEDELLKLDKVAELDKYLAELEEEQGPIPEADLIAAEKWGDAIFGPIEAERRSA